MLNKVLIMCTGNSCRSIIAEALINTYLSDVIAYSCGVNPSGKINPNAQKVLEQNNCWDNKYYSKDLDAILDIDFDLVVTVCDNAKETCPVFPKATKVIHIGFEDPDGKEFDAFVDTYNDIKTILLPKLKNNLQGDKMDDIIREVIPKNMSKLKINIDEFIELYNSGKAELLDIRADFEQKVWQLNFGLKIAANELPDNLDKLPKDKIIVVACPGSDRSNMARFYLASKGFDVRYLSDGLIELMGKLRGGKAKLINV